MVDTRERTDGSTRRRRILEIAGTAGLSGLLAGCSSNDDGNGAGNGNDSGDDEDGNGSGNGDTENGNENGNDNDDTGNGEGADTATFNVQALDPSAEEIEPGENFGLTATVENTGNAAGTQEITLSVDDEERDSVEETLDAGGSVQVEFTELTSENFEYGAEYLLLVATDDDEATATISTPSQDGLTALSLETVAEGFNDRVVAMATAPGADLLYFVDRSGEILVRDEDGLRDEPFLDLTDTISTGDREEGIMGLAFHPDFEANRLCYVRYTSPTRTGTPNSYNHTCVLSEFEANEGGLTADRATERTVLEVPQPHMWHNSGNILFGPDGYLYATFGDGGHGNDQGHGHVDDWYDGVEGGNGQDTSENLLGSVLRLDVDSEPTAHPRTDADAPDEPESEEGYAIPEDNPLVGEEGHLAEHWAWGLRNPWGTSFDGEDLYLADVGQSGWEEVNLIEKGGNYGWNVKEGTHCFLSDSCPGSTPEDVRGGEPLLDPIIEYPHDSSETTERAPFTGRSIIGGAVYRGDAIEELAGQYLFADHVHGDRMHAAVDDGGLWEARTIPISEADGDRIDRVLAVGQDADGELLVSGTVGGFGSGSSVYRLVRPE